MRQEIHLYPEPQLASLVDTIQEVDAFVDATGMSAEQAHSFTAALEEYLTSVILYGLEQTSEPKIHIRVKREEGEISCELIYNGAEFDPTTSQKGQVQGAARTNSHRRSVAVNMLAATGGNHAWVYEDAHNHLTLHYEIC